MEDTGVQKMLKVGVRFTKADVEWLKAEAASRGITVSDLVRMAVEQFKPKAKGRPPLEQYTYAGCASSPCSKLPDLVSIEVYVHSSGLAVADLVWQSTEAEIPSQCYKLHRYYSNSLKELEQHFIESFRGYPEFEYHWGTQPRPKCLDEAEVVEAFEVVRTTQEVLKVQPMGV